MKTNIAPILPNRIYHIYNRGIAKMPIFEDDSNYHSFLKKYFEYINPIADTYVYCLMRNHFHFMIKIKSEADIRELFSDEKYASRKIEFIISKQFSNFFNSYAQSFNKWYSRTGGLFEEPFRRKEILTDQYFSTIIAYIHLNPSKEMGNERYKNYPYSSYSYIVEVGLNNTPCQRVPIHPEIIIDWFGSIEYFIQFHENQRMEFQ